MAFDYLTEYPGQMDGTDLLAYPYGKAANITTPGDGSGTPWEKRIVNDWLGFFQAVLKDSADIVPSGAADEVGASQYLDGLKIIMGRGGVKLATANYTILKDDGFELILVTTSGGNIDITLSDVADSPGRKVKVKMVDAGGTVTVKTESALVTIDGIDGTVGIILDDQYQSIEVFEGDALWNIAVKFSSTPTPVGTMLDYASATPPSGFLSCDGTAVSRTTYARLFAIVGTTFGIGDGATTFNLPNSMAGFDTEWVDFTPVGSQGDTLFIARWRRSGSDMLVIWKAGFNNGTTEDKNSISFKIPVTTVTGYTSTVGGDNNHVNGGSWSAVGGGGGLANRNGRTDYVDIAAGPGITDLVAQNDSSWFDNTAIQASWKVPIIEWTAEMAASAKIIQY